MRTLVSSTVGWVAGGFARTGLLRRVRKRRQESLASCPGGPRMMRITSKGHVCEMKTSDLNEDYMREMEQYWWWRVETGERGFGNVVAGRKQISIKSDGQEKQIFFYFLCFPG
uniref:Uncharacterized protein n=1 Tax=Ananas comosus var. bracteatus TaxID=296719 RepID=A0A6V7QW89_ANACO